MTTVDYAVQGRAYADARSDFESSVASEFCDVPCQADAAVCLASLSYRPFSAGDGLTKCPWLSWWERSCNSGVIRTTCVALSTELVFL